MITFEQIQKANEGMTGIDFKGKNYVMVNSRVTAFRKLFPEGFITTNIISLDAGVVVMQTKVGYYDNGNEIVLATGLAYEREQTSYINKTSFIENCETSAVGRALGFLALGNDDSICSAEELVNAIKTQEQIKAQERAECQPPIPDNGKNPVVTSKKIPAQTPEVAYLIKAMRELREEREINPEENKKLFNIQKTVLVEGGLAPNKDIKDYTLDELKNLIDAMRKNFTPTGTEMKVG